MTRHPTNETYVPLSRGLIDHLPGMAKGCRLALYVYLLMNARYSGSHKGKFASSFADISLFLGVHYKTVWKAAQWLKEKKYIAYVGAKNQHDVTIFTITKYKTVEDFVPPTALSRAYGPETQSEVKARSKRGQSKPKNANDFNELQDRNNINNVNKIINDDLLFSITDFFRLVAEKLNVLDHEGSPNLKGFPTKDRGTMIEAWNDYGPFARQVVELALDATLKQQEKKGESLPIIYHLKAVANLQAQDGHKYPLYPENREGMALADELADKILGGDGRG